MVIINKTIDYNPTLNEIGIEKVESRQLATFHIFHCIIDEYICTQVENQPRKYVATVYAYNVEEAFKKAHNSYIGSEYQSYNVRDISIGDFIQDSNGFYMVTESGFEFIAKIEL